MIAYVQEQTFSHWHAQVNGWIRDLSSETDSAWNATDALQPQKDDPDRRTLHTAFPPSSRQWTRGNRSPAPLDQNELKIAIDPSVHQAVLVAEAASQLDISGGETQFGTGGQSPTTSGPR